MAHSFNVMVGLGHLGGSFQPRCVYDSVTPTHRQKDIHLLIETTRFMDPNPVLVMLSARGSGQRSFLGSKWWHHLGGRMALGGGAAGAVASPRHDARRAFSLFSFIITNRVVGTIWGCMHSLKGQGLSIQEEKSH